ncbi:hypothetical protein ACGFLS_04840 [Streptomyces abikoensis]|uniref:hypothetical protein n=1 Tax=Streptomyces abikoensis TaxID=97398 RepID=UPI00371C014C
MVVLALTACAVLAGASSVLAVGEWIADTPSSVLECLGVIANRTSSNSAEALGRVAGQERDLGLWNSRVRGAHKRADLEPVEFRCCSAR